MKLIFEVFDTVDIKAPRTNFYFMIRWIPEVSTWLSWSIGQYNLIFNENCNEFFTLNLVF